MDVVHRILAYVAIAAILIGLVWALLVLAHRLPADHRFMRFQTLVIGMVLAASVIGAVQFVLLKATPGDDLHLVYGAVAVLLIPLARSFKGGGGRRDAIICTVVFVLMAGVMYRLAATG